METKVSPSGKPRSSRLGEGTDHAQAAHASSSFSATNNASVLTAVTRRMLVMPLEGRLIAMALNIGADHYKHFWAREQKGKGKQAKGSALRHRFTTAFHQPHPPQHR